MSRPAIGNCMICECGGVEWLGTLLRMVPWWTAPAGARPVNDRWVTAICSRCYWSPLRRLFGVRAERPAPSLPHPVVHHMEGPYR